MDLNDSLVVRRSTFSESILDDSSISNSTLQSTNDLTKGIQSTHKLSITLNQEEKEILRKNAVNDHKMNKTPTSNESLHSSTDTLEETSTSTLKNSKSSTQKGETMVTDVLDEDEDVSVIPVEEVSTLEVSEQTNTDSTKVEMFSHLQPNKIIEERNILEESVQDHRMSESFADTSEYLQDESNLFEHPFVEVGRRLWPSTMEKQFYIKGCLWSPDGTCLLVPVHLDGMHIVELPTDLYTLRELNINRNLSDLTSAVHVREGGTVYDCCWYPYMNSTDPTTCSWISTRQHEPIHMWDAFSGELRCSYRGYDDVDEVESAISVIFSNDGEKVIGGYKKNIKVFDTNIPGRNYNSITVKRAISCFALTTDNDNCVTAGTWSGNINHFDLRAPKLGPLFTLGGHSGGITWLKYSPRRDQNWYLFSGARKDNKILQWDMRNYKKPLQIFERNVQTNQRIYFDLTPLHTWLASGDTEGLLRIWNLDDKNQYFELPLHQDCCNGVSFHPSLPIICTTSGQYHFVDITDTEEQFITIEKIINYENSLIFLWYGPLQESES